MSQVITFEDYTPSPRYDGIPWSEVRVEESDTTTYDPDVTVWTQIDVIALSPIDSDPTQPQSRDVTTSNASDDMDLWYRLIFADAGGATLLPTYPIQNSAARPTYATVEELAGLLGVNAVVNFPSLRRVLQAAAHEIDTEVGLTTPYGSPPPLAVEVNLERAVEHWRQMKAPFGIIGLGPELGSSFTAQNSWERHAQKLASLKEVWGIA